MPAPVQTAAVPNPQAPAPAPEVIKPPEFDGVRAYGLLKAQCDFGPRPLGTPAHDKTRAFLISEMKKYADKTVLQEFTYRGMTVTNVVGIFYPAGATAPSRDPVLLLSHWDTRPVADGPFSSKPDVNLRYGPAGWNHETPILGANDGASSTAVLLELARGLKARRGPVGVVMLLDDGEDYGDFRAKDGKGDGVELGSRYFALHYRETRDFGHPRYGILLDMVGGKNLVLRREMVSQRYAPEVNDKVFGIASSLGFASTFRGDENEEVNDDHVSVNEAGIPTIDLLQPLPSGEYDDGAYVYWHTLQDTPYKCSAQSLEIVGRTIAAVLYQEAAAR